MRTPGALVANPPSDLCAQRRADRIRAALRSAGYAFVDEVFDRSLTGRFSKALDCAMAREEKEYGKAFLQKIGQTGYVSDLLGIGPEAAELLNSPALHDLVDAAFGEEVRLFAAQGIILRPGEGRNVWPRCWHADMYGISRQIADPSFTFAVNFLVLIDDVHQGNGATAIIPGSHRHEAFDLPTEDLLKDRIFQATGKAGSICMIEGGTWHAAGFNRSQAARRVLKLMFTRRWFRPQIDYLAAAGSATAHHLSQKARQWLNVNA